MSLKKYIIGFLSGLIVMSAVVYAADILTSADSVSYKNEQTVADALDDLLGKADATSENILSGKTAYVNGELITGAMANKGAWTGNEPVDGKIMIPEGYHDGTGYIDVSGYATSPIKVTTISHNAGSNVSYNVCTDFPDEYTNLTTDNFIIDMKKIYAPDANDRNCTITKSYDSNTGVLSINGLYWQTCTFDIYIIY